MEANIGDTDSLQSAFSNRIQSISNRNQDVLSKWQDKQETKIDMDEASKYGDQAQGIGETIEQLGAGAYEAKNYLDAKRQEVGDKVERQQRKRRNAKRKIRKKNGEEGVSDEEYEGEIKRDSAGNEVKREKVSETNDERTDDAEKEGEGQHNTGGSPENPEEVATDTHEGEGSGGRPNEPQPVPDESPTDNGGDGGDPEPEPTPEPTPDEPEIEPASLVEPVETPAPAVSETPKPIGAQGEPSGAGEPVEISQADIDKYYEPDEPFDTDLSRSGMFGEGSSRLTKNVGLQNRAEALYGGAEQDLTKQYRRERTGFGIELPAEPSSTPAKGLQTISGVESEFSPASLATPEESAGESLASSRRLQVSGAKSRLNSLYGSDDAMESHIANNSTEKIGAKVGNLVESGRGEVAES